MPAYDDEEPRSLLKDTGGMPGAASEGALQVLKHVFIRCVLYAGTRAFTVLGTLSRVWRDTQRLGFEVTRYRIRWAFLLRSNMPNVLRARSRSRSREKKPAKKESGKEQAHLHQSMELLRVPVLLRDAGIKAKSDAGSKFRRCMGGR